MSKSRTNSPNNSLLDIQPIDPTNLSDEQAELLHRFLTHDENQTKSKKRKFFSANKTYPYAGKSIQFTHDIIRITQWRYGKKHYLYYIYKETNEYRIGEGGFGTVYKTLGQLTHRTARMQYKAKTRALKIQKPKITLIDEPGQKRGKLKSVEIPIDIESTKNENRLAQRFPHTKTQKVSFRKNTIGSVRESFMPMALFTGVTLEEMARPCPQDKPEKYLAGRSVLRENIPGKSILSQISTAELSILTINLIEAVQAMHAAGVIHRDLKPENIFIDANLKVSIIDFGLARRADEPDWEAVGTPHWMSPEILLTPEDANEASDIYSLGQILRYVWGDPRYNKLGSSEAILRAFDGEGTSAASKAKKKVFLADAEINPTEPLIPLTKQSLTKLLDNMTSEDPATRPSLATILTDFEKLFNPISNQVLNKAIKAGIDLKHELQVVPNVINDDKIDIENIKQLINSKIKKIDATPQAIADFKLGLGCKELAGKTKKKLRETIQAIFSSYQRNIANLNDPTLRIMPTTNKAYFRHKKLMQLARYNKLTINDLIKFNEKCALTNPAEARIEIPSKPESNALDSLLIEEDSSFENLSSSPIKKNATSDISKETIKKIIGEAASLSSNMTHSHAGMKRIERINKFKSNDESKYLAIIRLCQLKSREIKPNLLNAKHSFGRKYEVDLVYRALANLGKYLEEGVSLTNFPQLIKYQQQEDAIEVCNNEIKRLETEINKLDIKPDELPNPQLRKIENKIAAYEGLKNLYKNKSEGDVSKLTKNETNDFVKNKLSSSRGYSIFASSSSTVFNKLCQLPTSNEVLKNLGVKLSGQLKIWPR